jgi:hypothetical protein
MRIYQTDFKTKGIKFIFQTYYFGIDFIEI